jgi:hypothetical protein
MAGSNRRFAFAAILLPLLFLTMSGLARANDIFVNTTDGESPAAPLCSLPDAITAHNLQTIVNGCAAGNGLDVIFIEVTGTILIDEPLEITNGIVTIQGPLFGCSGAGPCGITINGEDTVEIVEADAGTSVFLFNLTLADGSANTFTGGGAVSANGTLLQVFDSTFLNNTAHGPDATDGGRGGAISQLSNGEVDITNSTFVGNTAVPGTTSGDSFGGAIYSTASSSTTRLTVTNSTFSGNSASKGGVYHTMNNHPMLKGDILANSTGKNCGALKPIDNGFNISDDVGCSFSGTSVNSTNPQLDPDGLENNGGPTETIDLQPTSPAINRIPVPCTDQETPTPQQLLTDQRLFGRPDALNPNFCDSGALEFGAVPPIVIVPNTVKLAVARSTTANKDEVNTAFTFIYNGDPSCDLGPGGDEDALNSGFLLSIFEGTCASLPANGLKLTLFPFVVHTVNHQSYGTLFQTSSTATLQQSPETVSARLITLPTPAGACSAFGLNLEVAGLNTAALGMPDGNPFAIVIEDSGFDASVCFDVSNAIVGNQTPPPPHKVRRRVRR